MRHLVRDLSRVLTLLLASRQAWPKILGGEVSMFGGEKFPPPQRCLDNTLLLGQCTQQTIHEGAMVMLVLSYTSKYDKTNITMALS